MKYDDFSAIVAGGGSIGCRHAKNLRHLGVATAIAEPDVTARNTITDDLGIVTYESFSAAIQSESPDFVVVATPTQYHVDIALEAARSGCHLFIEKPISSETKGLSELDSIVSEKNLTSLVGCNLRFHPEVAKIHELVQTGVLGNVAAIRIEGGSYLPDWFQDSDYRESYSARSELGGGVLLDYIHEINYARWIFGEFNVVSAMADKKSELDIDTNDIVGVVAELADGTLCQIHLDYIQRSYSRSCHVIGESGTLHWSWSDEQVNWYVSEENKWNTFHRPDDWELNDMYLAEMKHFLDCLLDSRKTTCPVACGRRDLAVALAARKSSSSGRHISVEQLEE